MKWIQIDTILPLNPGKYILKTKTMAGNIHRVESYFNGKAFNITNQVIIAWLYEE